MQPAKAQLDALFRPPLAASARDVGVTPSTVQEASKVLLALASGGKTREQIALHTGLSREDTARALHYLVHTLEPALVEKTAFNDGVNHHERYYLTEIGKKSVPSEPPRIAARRHIDGMGGKVNVDDSGQIHMKGAKGAIIDCLRNGALLTADEIAERTGLHKNTVWLMTKELAHYKLIDIIHDGNRKRYKLPTPKPAAVSAPATPPTPTVEAPAPNPIDKALGIAPPPEKLEITIKSLLEAGYDPADIMLTTITAMDQEVRDLRRFKETMLATL